MTYLGPEAALAGHVGLPAHGPNESGRSEIDGAERRVRVGGRGPGGAVQPLVDGLLFVHDRNAPGYVMRDMAFPIDIVFVDSDGEITTIHHAAVDAERTFRGPGRYVLELPYNYTVENGITVGDRVEIPAEYR